MPELLARVVGRGPQNLMTVHIVTGKMTTEMNVVFSEFRLRLGLADEGLFGGGCCFVQRSNHQIPHTAADCGGLGWGRTGLTTAWGLNGRRDGEKDTTKCWLASVSTHSKGWLLGALLVWTPLGERREASSLSSHSVVLGACCAVNVRAFPMSQILLPLFHTHKTG